VRGSAYWARQFLTQWIREALLIRVCHEGINVVNQSCNLVRRERQQRLRIGRRHDYRTTLVHVICEHQTLCQRLMAADDLRKAAGQERVWLDLYLNVQRDRYQPPEPSEADQFRIHHSGQDSPADLRL
jgi:predicted kinase